MKILVVDDDSLLRDLIVQILRLCTGALRTDLHTLEAGCGEEAISLLAKHPDISVVITDLKMPGLNGLAVLTASKNSRPERPVIVSSGNFVEISGITPEVLAKAGADLFLPKPYTPADFIRQIMPTLSLVR
ncbi:MAG: hypothetical protein A2849_03045 [Candidatus Taylorbacteria bacterium RIFCSPHIGHO2_01_FULL_51_15]|uniref:Response regulatory domain-containing protein n=1 Tax=Candidatus Taylorbacteria bacterium RIFCSPHIGHO2_01_FULL_51_15 TaxID=1802304 RepID=A0A1G2M9I4_9BACT|nr:MAG: hypothetical protein A2849_03045 [Candidatus Taylorbacteria bacterium RIFCSPHIGHO2_01_FULL_51_15]